MRRASGGGRWDDSQRESKEMALLKHEVEVRTCAITPLEALSIDPFDALKQTQRLRQHVPACRRIPKLLVLDLNGLLVHRVFIGEGPRAGERGEGGVGKRGGVDGVHNTKMPDANRLCDLHKHAQMWKAHFPP